MLRGKKEVKEKIFKLTWGVKKAGPSATARSAGVKSAVGSLDLGVRALGVLCCLLSVVFLSVLSLPSLRSLVNRYRLPRTTREKWTGQVEQTELPQDS